MSHPSSTQAKVVALCRYPVKSMRGEDLNASEVTPRGLLGDRAIALIDAADGKVVSAKNPRKWPAMFDCRADFVEPPNEASPLPPVRITLPDGSRLRSDQPDAADRLSNLLGRAVRIATAAPESPQIEQFWLDLDVLPRRDEVTSHFIPEGTFFDCAVVHVLTTATLERLGELVPRSRFDPRRFRPNLVLETTDGTTGFVENAWVGRTLAIGAGGVRLHVTGPCPRCVMTTLPQSDLRADPAILRAAVEHNDGNVGIYATVIQPGSIRRGDVVSVE